MCILSCTALCVYVVVDNLTFPKIYMYMTFTASLPCCCFLMQLLSIWCFLQPASWCFYFLIIFKKKLVSSYLAHCFLLICSLFSNPKMFSISNDSNLAIQICFEWIASSQMGNRLHYILLNIV
jgi:hypothetical protein